MILSSRKKTEKHLSEVRINWSRIIGTGIVGFFVSAMFAAIGFLASSFLSVTGKGALPTKVGQALLIWLVPTIVLLITLAIVHEQIHHKKWLQTSIVFLLMIALWLCLFWGIAVF